mmetsp:Transcript_19368/g.56655  ORF Transcript_19368/g.56655 Transcript_19368/m.56655 type:complete len:91 (+) Transcript_19368:1250-1522(+)
MGLNSFRSTWYAHARSFEARSALRPPEPLATVTVAIFHRAYGPTTPKDVGEDVEFDCDDEDTGRSGQYPSPKSVPILNHLSTKLERKVLL